MPSPPSAILRAFPHKVTRIHIEDPFRAELYLPQGIAQPVPVIIWLDGGKHGSGPDLTRFLAERGFAMAAIDCGPGQVECVRSAMRSLHTIASQYRFDADRVGLWGAGQGAHLAAKSALRSLG